MMFFFFRSFLVRFPSGEGIQIWQGSLSNDKTNCFDRSLAIVSNKSFYAVRSCQQSCQQLKWSCSYHWNQNAEFYQREPSTRMRYLNLRTTVWDSSSSSSSSFQKWNQNQHSVVGKRAHGIRRVPIAIWRISSQHQQWKIGYNVTPSTYINCIPSLLDRRTGVAGHVRPRREWLFLESLRPSIHVSSSLIENFPRLGNSVQSKPKWEEWKKTKWKEMQAQNRYKNEKKRRPKRPKWKHMNAQAHKMFKIT